jgi:hypothetical protein
MEDLCTIECMSFSSENWISLVKGRILRSAKSGSVRYGTPYKRDALFCHYSYGLFCIFEIVSTVPILWLLAQPSIGVQ